MYVARLTVQKSSAASPRSASRLLHLHRLSSSSSSSSPVNHSLLSSAPGIHSTFAKIPGLPSRRFMYRCSGSCWSHNKRHSFGTHDPAFHLGNFLWLGSCCDVVHTRSYNRVDPSCAGHQSSQAALMRQDSLGKRPLPHTASKIVT